MTLSRWSRFLGWMLAGLAVCAVSASASVSLNAPEKAAVASLSTAGSGMKRLDVSNAKTRLALTALWRAAGLSADKIAARLKPPAAGIKKAAANDPAPTIVDLGYSGHDWTKVKAHNFVATGVETSTTDVTLALLDASENPIADGTSSSQNSSVPLFTSTSEGDNAASGVLYTVVVVYIQYKDGTPGTFTLRVSGTGLPTALDNQAPVATGTTQAVPRILVCPGKAYTGCDYTLAQSGQGKVQFPLKGSVTFSGPIDLDKKGNPDKASSALMVTSVKGGALCPLAGAKSFLDNKNTTVSGATISWDFSAADFGTACYSANGVYDLVLSMMVQVGGKPVWAAIASDASMAGAAGNMGTLAAQTIQMLKGGGGIANGTLVTMADNSTKVIETIAVGDTVKGIVPMTVYATVKGTMAQSNTLTVAPDSVTTIFEQLLPTQRGLLQAQNVLLSDSVTTANGPTQIVERSQKRLSSPQGVTNLFLTPQGGGSSTAPTYLAGGIQVQDATSP